MNIKQQIPNIITLGNLFCGTVATIFAVQGDFVNTALFVALGIGFDFFDGFVARILNVQGEFGKQLDSLADMVTSGVAPGIVMYQLFTKSLNKNTLNSYDVTLVETTTSFLPYLGLLLTVFACYRLAKFNLDERQLLLSFLMISELPLFSLKFKNYGLKDNVIKYVFLIICVLLLIFLKFVALPVAIVVYVLFSVFENFKNK